MQLALLLHDEGVEACGRDRHGGAVAEGGREVEEVCGEHPPLVADVGENDADELRLEPEWEAEHERRERTGPAQRGAFLDARLDERGHVVAAEVEERLPACRVPRDLGERHLIVGASREEAAQGAFRRFAPEEPEVLEAEGAQHRLADEPEHLLQLERRGDGPAHLVEGRHLLVAIALEENALLEDGLAVELEENGPEDGRHAAARDRENPVGKREVAPHARREGGEIASRRPDRERDLPARPPRAEECHPGQEDDERERQCVAARAHPGGVDRHAERNTEGSRDRDRNDVPTERLVTGREDAQDPEHDLGPEGREQHREARRVVRQLEKPGHRRDDEGET